MGTATGQHERLSQLIDPIACPSVQICGKNYTPELLKHVDPENLPEYLGGTSKATLLDDCGPWNNDAVNQAASLERALSHTQRASARQPSYSRTSSSASPERKRHSMTGALGSQQGTPAGATQGQGQGQQPLLPSGPVREVPPSREAVRMPELATPFGSTGPAGSLQDGLEAPLRLPSGSAPDDSEHSSLSHQHVLPFIQILETPTEYSSSSAPDHSQPS